MGSSILSLTINGLKSLDENITLSFQKKNVFLQIVHYNTKLIFFFRLNHFNYFKKFVFCKNMCLTCYIFLKATGNSTDCVFLSNENYDAQR